MKNYIIPLVFLVLGHFSYAQVDEGDPNFGSIQRGSQGIGANVPYLYDDMVSVNHSTGVANINIPLLSLMSLNQASMQASISYATSGLRVNDRETEVGLNWQLSGIGSITRIMRDLPDEDPVYGYLGAGVGTQLMTLTDIHAEAPPNCRDIQLASVIREASNYSTNADCFIESDTQPDYFSFEFFGKSGRIVLAPDGTPQVVPRNNFRIKPAIGPLNEGTNTWIITDSDGYQYFFEVTESKTISSYNHTRDRNLPFSPGNPTDFDAYDEDIYWKHVTGQEFLTFEKNRGKFLLDDTDINFTSKWLLTKVQNANDEVLFNVSYLPGNEVVTTTMNESLTAYFHGNVPWFNDGARSTYRIFQTVTSCVQRKIDEVTSPLGGLKFSYYDAANNQQILNKIQLNDLNDQLIDELELGYKTVSNNQVERVFLESLIYNGQRNYTFGYNGVSGTSWDSNHFPNTPYADVWGYFKDDGTALYVNKLPNETGGPANAAIGGSNDIFYPILSSTELGVLKTITNRYAGEILFDYQLNELNPYTVGGLRVDGITYTGGTTPVKRKFDYQNFQSAVPYLTNKRSVSASVLDENGTNCDGPGDILEEYFVTIRSGFDNFYPRNYYQKTTESVSNPSLSGDYGKTVYTFSENSLLERQDWITDFDLRRGRPIKVETFGAGNKLLRKRDITYEQVGNETLARELTIRKYSDKDFYGTCDAMNTFTFYQNRNIGVHSYIPTFTPIQNSYYRQSQVIESIYETGQSPIQNVSNYLYNTAGQRIQSNSQLGSGELVAMQYLYPTSFSIDQTASSAMDGFTEAIEAMKLRNIIDQPLQTEEYRDQVLVSSQIYEWDFMEQAGRPLYGGYLFNKSMRYYEGDHVPNGNRLMSIDLVGSEYQVDYDPLFRLEYTNAVGLVATPRGTSFLKNLGTTSRDGLTSSMAYQYEQIYPKISIVRDRDILDVEEDFYYFNFEDDPENLPPFNDGSGSQVVGQRFSGKYGYQFRDRNESILSFPVYWKSYAQNYFVTFWSDAANDTEMRIEYFQSDVALTKVRTVNGMHLWKGEFTVPAGTKGQFANLSVLLSNMTIDDLLIVPEKSQVTTYTHDLLIGTSSLGDINQERAFYEYDALRRLKTVRDIDGNILEQYDYQYTTTSN